MQLFQTIDINLLIKHSLLLDIFLSMIEIYLSNIHHLEPNINKSINRKIAIILTAKFNRIMLKEIFAQAPLNFHRDIFHSYRNHCSGSP